MSARLAVIAIGGNSLIKDRYHQTVRDQYIAAKETCDHVVSLIQDGWDVVIAHGNGPQVGFILRRSELSAGELHQVPVDACVADTQGAIGYALQQNLQNDFQQFGLNKQAVTIVTQVEVDPSDPAFQTPSKPIGSFMEEAKARKHADEDGWNVVEDAGRGWRRVIPSPIPMKILEEQAIRDLLNAGVIVIAVGGGGIPVIRKENGLLKGVAAVIDKDLSAALLASNLGAELFIISTDVDQVALHYGKADEHWIDSMTVTQAEQYLAEGIHFGAGSMAPKIQAAVNFLKSGGQRTIITSPENIERALAGETGTHITNE